MKELTVKDVLRECHGTLLVGERDVCFRTFSIDTRTIQQGDVYVGIYGENVDGNQFFDQAFQKGAIACILDRIDLNYIDITKYTRPIILVEDSVLALQQLATYKRSLVQIPVVAVTGSVGKTSTKEMIASVLETKYRVLKTPGNLNGQIGLPLSILHLKDEEIMVLEMGMNDFGQISILSKIAKPTMGVITNIGTAHLGLLGSRENILKAKLEILEGMPQHSPLIINADNDLLSPLMYPNYSIYRCGILAKADYMAEHLEMDFQTTSFVLKCRDEKEKIILPVMGEAFVMNSLLAVAVGDFFQVPLSDIKKGLEHFHMADNRMEFVSLKDHMLLINDSYNSNYEALKSALSVLVNCGFGRKIAVLGDVLELNEFGREIHEKIGHLEEIMKIDALFLRGENAFYIKTGAMDQGFDEKKIFYFSSNDELENALKAFLEPNDTILVKSSKGMKFSKIAENLKESYLL
ncbi:MAG: UDP-N-acetylmuramoyl-tripeptide--D-alanyl-D-alanine ligase [Bacilli bacterium]|jgi:UDP-N-acetylmuramoyl-tripeptide--D-alanyl-D-alanine ligase|nr:UDP-N-acetylmuramoyl-tripeptide--D-alanyl-D-alanine ligase [Bacilli bacterium]